MVNISVNTTLLNESYVDPSQAESLRNILFIMHVATYVIAGVGLPLLLMAIYALYSLVKNGQVAPIYIINLFISDLIQLCAMVIWESVPEEGMISKIVVNIYNCGLLTSVGFMVCISLERYLLIAHPLWYRFRRTIRISVVVCVVVWIIPLVCYPWVSMAAKDIIISIFCITPFPLFIFFLVGTLRALSTSVSVPADEKRRITAILVLVLLIYTLLFLPNTIFLIAVTYFYDVTLDAVSSMFVQLSPLADLLLYVFIKKETFGKLWTSVCCCRKENNDSNNINIELDHM